MFGVQSKLNTDGINLTNVQYASIGSQVKFIDTIDYYNQSLSSLAKSVDENEKKKKKTESLPKICWNKLNIFCCF